MATLLLFIADFILQRMVVWIRGPTNRHNAAQDNENPPVLPDRYSADFSSYHPDAGQVYLDYLRFMGPLISEDDEARALELSTRPLTERELNEYLLRRACSDTWSPMPVHETCVNEPGRIDTQQRKQLLADHTEEIEWRLNRIAMGAWCSRSEAQRYHAFSEGDWKEALRMIDFDRKNDWKPVS